MGRLNPLLIGEVFPTMGKLMPVTSPTTSLNPLLIGEVFPTLAKISPLGSAFYTLFFRHLPKKRFSFASRHFFTHPKIAAIH